MPDNENKSVRLQVFLARSGVASRRASEKIILDGRVSVNGTVVTELGTKVTPDDKVLLDGKEISLEETMRYVLLNKPKGYVCSSNDEKGREKAIDLLKENYSERLYNVGRLDMFSSGLIIFTNDGDFASVLSHPECPERNIQVVGDDEQVFKRQFQFVHPVSDSLSAEIHICRWLQEDEFPSFD